jgi:hypothetical protein
VEKEGRRESAYQPKGGSRIEQKENPQVDRGKLARL